MDLDHPDRQTSPTASVRAADSIVFALQQDIQTGTLADGATLPTERDLMQRFDVSRTVIREAITTLSSKGLVETRPRYRPVVRKPGIAAALQATEGIALHLLTQPGGIRHLFETRILVESALVREAADAAGKEGIAALKAALDLNEAAIHDSARFYETDAQFHQVLYQMSGNPILPAIHKAYETWLVPQWSQLPRDAALNQSNFEAHQMIFEAILMRDKDAAEAALRSHLNTAWDQIKQTFGTE
ncbi:FCD domain-containing protein [Algirhabdus cladophorae]|uniref:FCD domain-containing protein n=1 Tax=Algirhabdus cladophorae TaxID=3377108 RepID=UPI003B8474A2